MARIPEEVIERIKAEVSLIRLVERYGIELKKHGKDKVGRCPFHEDNTPSLTISEVKNVFHCFGCGAKGTPIDWVMKTEGVSFRHAVEVLQNDIGVLGGDPNPVKRTSRRKLDVPFEREADDQVLLNQVIDFYHETLLQSPEALDYLDKRGLGDRELIERFKLGFANRTLAYRLPAKQYKAGRQMRGRLQQLGILRQSGHEHFNGSVVIPVLDAEGNVMQAYGRKIRDDLRKGTSKHLYLSGQQRGVFNLDGLRDTEEVIICEALIDALTVCRFGFKHVTASFGVNGFTGELLAALRDNGINRALIAYDRDDAGDAAAAELADRLNGEGIGCYRLHCPRGLDVNGYAVQRLEAGGRQAVVEAFGQIIRNAEWMGSGQAPAITTATDTDNEAQPPENPKAKAQFEKQLKEVSEQMQAVNNAEPLPAKAEPDAPNQVEADVADHEIKLAFGDRRYRVRGFEKNLSYETLRINLLASRSDLMHVDTFDIYSARHRQTFIKQAAGELEVEENVIKKDVGKVLLKLELLQEEQIQQTLKPQDSLVQLTDVESQDALTLLKAPDLLDRIVADVEHCGLVGENNNALAGYLACISRKLKKPLAILVQSTSAAGKSSLMDAVLAMMPDEDRVQYSAMTGQSLFYMGETNLKHKILAIAEEEGVAQASYALKLLQSEGELTIASTAKDPQSGRLETQEYHVEGPVMLFLTTTAIDNDEELLNRCLVLSVNESREQTRAIHERQRFECTLEGMLTEHDRDGIVKRHRNAQRLLKPLKIVNPYAKHLTFVDDKTRTRRDQQKYLTLINSIALLHQYQREIKTTRRNGELIEYVEVTLADIEIANRLAHEMLGRTLDELPPQTRNLLKQIYAMVQADCEAQGIEQADVRFSRRQVREYTGWGNTQLKVHLRRLEEFEYLLPHRGGRGQSFVYELLYQGEGEHGDTFMMGLIDVESLRYDENRSGVKPDRSGSSRPQVGAKSGDGRGKQNGKKQNGSETYENKPVLAAESTAPAQKTKLS